MSEVIDHTVELFAAYFADHPATHTATPINRQTVGEFCEALHVPGMTSEQLADAALHEPISPKQCLTFFRLN